MSIFFTCLMKPKMKRKHFCYSCWFKKNQIPTKKSLSFSVLDFEKSRETKTLLYFILVFEKTRMITENMKTE